MWMFLALSSFSSSLTDAIIWATRCCCCLNCSSRECSVPLALTGRVWGSGSRFGLLHLAGDPEGTCGPLLGGCRAAVAPAVPAMPAPAVFVLLLTIKDSLPGLSTAAEAMRLMLLLCW